MRRDTDRKREFTPAELARLPNFYHPCVSPDGDRLAYYHDETGRNELYVQEITGGATPATRERVSDGEVPRAARWPIQWDPRGDRVYFHRDEGGDEQNDIWEVTLEGTAAPVVETDGQAVLHDVTAGGRVLVYASDVGDQLNLYAFDRETGESTQLTHSEKPVRSAILSPDDERLAYTTNESDVLENQDVYVANADGSDARKLALGEVGAEASVADWHPDGERLLVADDTEDVTHVGVYELPTDTVEWLSEGRVEESAVAFGPNGDTAFAIRIEDAAARPVVYDLDTGACDGLDLSDGVASLAGGEHFLADGRVVLSQTTPDTRGELLAYDLDTGATEPLVEPDYGDIDPDAFVDAEYATYESTDGLEIGALYYDARDRPAGSEDERTPGVVMVHGGPHAQSMQSFDLYAQFLASQGYTVLQPNYRGSTGRGREFRQAILRDWGGMEQEDVAAGGRWLAALDSVDENRVAVFGGSYGGYSTYCQLTMHPDVWATGVAWIGITDLHALYEESMPHFQALLEQQLGDPAENEALWVDRSPVTHVDAMRAPICIVHGVNDPRCPISQARLFRDALEERGWTEGEDGEFEYEALEAEGHGSSDIQQKIRAFELIDDYLDRRL